MMPGPVRKPLAAGREHWQHGPIDLVIAVQGDAPAVARACATNPVALAIPCHRVVPAAGGEGGYRWGTARKRALLRQEGRRR